MSIELSWDTLDEPLASSLVELLNRQLANTQRPSFIGPVEVLSLDFGSESPDVELVDLRDIYRDFLEDDEEEEVANDPVKVADTGDDEDGFEWVSRRAAREEEYVYQQQLPLHVRYPRHGGPMDMFSSVPTLPSHMDLWNSPAAVARPSWPTTPVYRSPTPAAPFSAALSHDYEAEKQEESGTIPQLPSQSPDSQESSANPAQENPHPNLQLHLHIEWHSNLRITLTTSLLINYPSPMFMSLPIKLSVTGLVFTGEVAVAYEGARRRVHLCILDDLDPYGPTGDRSKRDSAGSTPPELDDDSPGSSVPPRPSKPLPVGQRLLPSIYIESEIGQADKHVLKNVTRVERFIQEVIRKTVEEELVFPNFHTLVMAEQ